MNCKNCQTSLEESDDYCSHCGGRVIRNRLTLKSLFHHINETFFNFDNKLLRTFLGLFTKPEDVIVGYIDGTRKKYVDVVAYFALAITLSGLQLFVLSRLDIDMSSAWDTSTEVGKQQQAFTEAIYKYTSDYQSLVMMMYIPFYALLAKLIFRKYKKFNYTELLVVFLYTQAHISIASVLLLPLIGLIDFISFTGYGMLVLLFQFGYFVYALKRVYGLTVMQIFLRTLLFLLIMLLLFVVATVIMAAVMYQMGMFDKLKDTA
ncbi:DUF3667 domain-containing protein [Cryomorphaceae bacterium 1068]|nr:DUF3667 domain-containing protein [Cryomorphaceae bacterium 1068]